MTQTQTAFILHQQEGFSDLIITYLFWKSNQSKFIHIAGLEKVAKAQEKKTNPNLSKLVSALRQHVVRGGEDIQTPALRVEREGAGLKTRAIVFVQTRMLAVALSSWLRSCPENDLKALNARKYTSTNVPVERGGMSAYLSYRICWGANLPQVDTLFLSQPFMFTNISKSFQIPELTL